MGQESEKGKVEWFASLFKTKLTLISIRNKRHCVGCLILKHRISLNNSLPSSKLPPLNNCPPLMEIFRIITPPHPSRHLHFLLSPSCQVEVESDPAKLISDNSSSENYIKEPNLQHLKKPLFSLFDVIIF